MGKCKEWRAAAPRPLLAPSLGIPSHLLLSSVPPQEEARQHNDTVVVRGADTYRQLPNKTVRLLRYAVAHPRRYTHVLKTDDDCYVRLPHLLKALEVGGLGVGLGGWGL